MSLEKPVKANDRSNQEAAGERAQELGAEGGQLEGLQVVEKVVEVKEC